MTLLAAIALIVAATLILVCGYLFVTILIRGRFETSGYTIDWRTSPVGMVIALVSPLVCPVLIIWGLAARFDGGADACMQPYRIYVDFHPGYRPDFRYEGPGVQRELVVTEDKAGVIQFSYSAMSLPPGVAWELDGVNDLPEYRVFDFSGSLSCSHGDCHLTGELQSRGRAHLVVVGAHDEVELHPGNNDITVTWNGTTLDEFQDRD
jgi:hypothetical protein